MLFNGLIKRAGIRIPALRVFQVFMQFV